MPIQSNYSSPYTTGAGTASGPGAGSRSALSGTASSKARALSDDNGKDTEKSNSSDKTNGSEKTNSKEGTNSTDSTGSSGNVIDAVFGDGDDKKVSMDDFLTLMVAQLKNQDFMNPVDDTQYVTQLAQISTMQQMEEMAYNAKSSYVASLVGKNVSAAKFTVSGELKKADGVVEIILQSCHTYNIEAHFIKRTVEAEGIPYLMIETDYSKSDQGQIATRLEALLETIS